MSFAQSFDFTPGTRVVVDDLRGCSREYEWLEEPYVSPDGERVAMISRAFLLAVSSSLKWW